MTIATEQKSISLETLQGESDHGTVFIGPYKSHIAKIEYSPEDEVFWGELISIKKGIISFESETFDGLPSEFKAAVDDYLQWLEAQSS